MPHIALATLTQAQKQVASGGSFARRSFVKGATLARRSMPLSASLPPSSNARSPRSLHGGTSGGSGTVLEAAAALAHAVSVARGEGCKGKDDASEVEATVASLDA